MKKLILSLGVIFMFVGLSIGQTKLVQGANITIKVSEIESQVFSNASLEVNPYQNKNNRIAWIDLVLVDSDGNDLGVLDVLKFSDCGEVGFVKNWEEFNAFQLAEYEHGALIDQHEGDILCLTKEQSREKYLYEVKGEKEGEDHKVRLEEIEKEIGSLAMKVVELREDKRFLPENRVYREEVHSLTYDDYNNLYVKDNDLTEAGKNLVRDRYFYRGYEPKEITVRVGQVGDFFVESRK